MRRPRSSTTSPKRTRAKSASLGPSPWRACRRMPQSPRSVPNPRRRQPRRTGRLLRRASSTTFLRPGSRTAGRRSGCCSSRLCRSPGSASRPRASRRRREQRIAVSIGPQFGTVDPEWIRLAAREATRGLGFDVLLVCAFAFDPQANEGDRGVLDRAGAGPARPDELRPGDGRRAAEEDRVGEPVHDLRRAGRGDHARRRRAHRRDQGRGCVQPDDRGDPVLGDRRDRAVDDRHRL